jgi:autophagy-related protein 18
VWSMNFNITGTLLVVSSDTETVHVYKLDQKDGNGKGGHDRRKRSVGERSASAASDTADGREGGSPPPSEGPSSPTLSTINPAYPSRERAGSPRDKGGATSSFSRRSLYLGKNLVGGMGGYLPKGVTDIWEPRRDFAFARMRGGGGGRCVVAMSP